MAAPVFGVTDVLVLGTGWEPQGSSATSSPTRATASGNDGDVVASTTHNEIESGTATYIYTGILTDFPSAIAAASADVGDVVDTDTLLITGYAIDYSPCAAGKRPTIAFSYRDGPDAASATYVSSLTTELPTYVATTPVVPDLLTVTGGDSETTNAQYALAAQFGEDLDKDGEYLAGETYNGEETISMSFVGDPDSITSTGWDQTGGPGANTGGDLGNTAYDTNTYTYVAAVIRS